LVIPEKRIRNRKIVPASVHAKEICFPAVLPNFTTKFFFWPMVSLSISGYSNLIMKKSPQQLKGKMNTCNSEPIVPETTKYPILGIRRPTAIIVNNSSNPLYVSFNGGALLNQPANAPNKPKIKNEMGMNK
jgi:hypothetical protein